MQTGFKVKLCIQKTNNWKRNCNLVACFIVNVKNRL